MICEQFDTDNANIYDNFTKLDLDKYIVTGIEDGWIEVDNKTWNEYLLAKERIKQGFY